MTHRPLVVVAHMLGAMVVNNPIHLDGLLLAAREKRDGFGSRGTPFPALAWSDGFFQASAGLFVTQGLGGVADDRIVRVRRLDMKSVGHRVAFPEGSTVAQRTIGSMSPYRNTMVADPVMGNISKVVWQALGDREEIEGLLEYVGSVGKMHRTGWGEVDRFEVLDSDADPATCGIFADGRPMRNVPVGFLDKFGIVGDIVYEGRLLPPYAASQDQVVIAAPDLAGLTVSDAEARRLFAY